MTVDVSVPPFSLLWFVSCVSKLCHWGFCVSCCSDEAYPLYLSLRIVLWSTLLPIDRAAPSLVCSLFNTVPSPCSAFDLAGSLDSGASVRTEAIWIWGTQKLVILPNATQPVSGRAGTASEQTPPPIALALSQASSAFPGSSLWKIYSVCFDSLHYHALGSDSPSSFFASIFFSSIKIFTLLLCCASVRWGGCADAMVHIWRSEDGSVNSFSPLRIRGLRGLNTGMSGLHNRHRDLLGNWASPVLSFRGTFL